MRNARLARPNWDGDRKVHSWNVLPFVIEQVDPFSEDVEELIEGRRRAIVGEDVLLGRLAEPLMQQAKLEVVD